MKKSLLSFVALSMAGLSTLSAQGFKGATVGAGDFYLYNIGAKKYLVGSNSWGTRSSFSDNGYLCTIAASGDGFTIDTKMSNGGDSHFLGSNGFVDAAAFNWVFTNVGTEEDPVYTIANGASLLGYDETDIVNLALTDAASTNAQWVLVQKSSMLEGLKAATADKPVDATFLIQYPNFNSDKELATDAWTNPNGLKTNGLAANRNIEKWQGNFHIYQDLKDIPNGKYELGVRGFYRAGGNAVVEANKDIKNAYFYAGEVKAPFMSILDGLSDDTYADLSDAGDSAVFNGQYVPNSQNAGSKAFINGLYMNEKISVIVTDGTLRVGVIKEAMINDDWTLFDDFSLTYYGVDLTALENSLNEKIKEAEAISMDGIPAAIATGFTNAIASAKAAEKTEAGYTAAITDLTAAINAIKEVPAQLESVNAAKDLAEEVLSISTADEATVQALKDAITKAQSDLDAVTKAEDIAAIATPLNEAIQAYMAVAAPNAGCTFDFTSKAGTDAASWNGDAVLAANSWANKTDIAFVEKYHSFIAPTGTIMSQQVTGLPQGVYAVEVYAHANFTADRGFESTAKDGDIIASVVANGVKTDVPMQEQSGVEVANKYTLTNVLVYEDGVMDINFNHDVAGANWFTVQIASIKMTAKDVPARYIDTPSVTPEAGQIDEIDPSGLSAITLIAEGKYAVLNATHVDGEPTEWNITEMPYLESLADGKKYEAIISYGQGTNEITLNFFNEDYSGINAVGKYKLVIPQGLYCIAGNRADWTDNKTSSTLNKAAEFDYEIVAHTSAEFAMSDLAETTDVYKFTGVNLATENIWAIENTAEDAPKVTLTDEQNKSYAVTITADPWMTAYGLPITITPTDGDITTPGTYKLIIPEKAFVTQYGDWNKAMDLTYVVSGGTIEATLVNPAQPGEIEELQTVTIACAGTLNTAEGAPKPTITPEGQQAVEATITAATSGEYTIGVETAFTAVGDYTVTIPEGLFVSEDGNFNPVITFDFAIPAAVDPELVPTRTEVEEGKNRVKLYFEGQTVAPSSNVTPSPEAPYLVNAGDESDYHKVTLNNDSEDATVIYCDIEGNLKWDATYKLVIPAGNIAKKDASLTEELAYTPLIEDTFTGHDLTAIAKVVAEGEKVDVYSVDGNLVMKSATADDVKALKKGVYVIKGKKFVK